MLSFLLALFLNAHLSAFGHSFAEDRCQASLIVRQEVGLFAPVLAERLNPILEDYANSLEERDQDVALHDDPLACRLCEGASRKTLRFLKRSFPAHKWRIVRAQDRNGLLEGYDHAYIYSPDLWLVVDPTYRQFLIGIPSTEFARLPRIFVGTPAEFSRLLRRYIPQESIDLLLGGIKSEAGPATRPF